MAIQKIKTMGFTILTLLLFLAVGFLFGGKGPFYSFIAWIVFTAIFMFSYAFSKGTAVGMTFILTVVSSFVATAAIVRGIKKLRMMEGLPEKEAADYGCTILIVSFLMSFFLFDHLFKFLLL